MLKRVNPPDADAYTTGLAVQPTPVQRGYDHLRAAARRQFRVVIITAVVGLGCGIAFVLTAVPRYTATAQLLIDGKKDKNDFSDSLADIAFDSSAIDSQVEVIKSEKVALAVLAGLNVKTDPEFAQTRPFVLQFLENAAAALNLNGLFVTRPKTEAEADAEQKHLAIEHLGRNLSVMRIPHTYVLAIDYTSADPFKAAQFANTFAEAYITDQLDSKFEATRRASGWMQSRIAELKQSSLASDSAVEKFKTEHGLVTADGKLVSDQQMTELNSAMMLSHSETAKAEARFAQISDMLNSGQGSGDVTDSLGSSTITDLRSKYLRASKTEAELEGKLGKDHLQVVSLRRDMADYQRLIFEELHRIAETYRSEVDVARAKEQSLKDTMAKMVDASAGTNQTLVQLRELQSEADTVRSMHQAFLARYQDAIQQQSFPVTQARVITTASIPTVPSFPKRSVALSLSLIFGLMAGVGIGAWRENRDRSFRVSAQVRDELGLEMLGLLPVIDKIVAYDKDNGALAAQQLLTPRDSLQTQSLDSPLSNFAETLRSIKVTLDLGLKGDKPKIMGFVSAFPSEGKSTVSKNFASLLAHLGAKTLLIDGDLRNPGLTRAVAQGARAGLIEVIRGERPMSELLLTEPESGLKVLPAVVKSHMHLTSELLSSAGMQNLLNDAMNDYEYIIVDLPPLGPVVDVRAAASMFDAFVFVVEWGRTPRQSVRTIMAMETQVYDRCIGVVLNKVKLRQINAYEAYGSKDYYSGYGKYYRDGKTGT